MYEYDKRNINHWHDHQPERTTNYESVQRGIRQPVYANSFIGDLEEESRQDEKMFAHALSKDLTPEDEQRIDRVFQTGIHPTIANFYGATYDREVIWSAFATVIVTRYGVPVAQKLGLAEFDGLLPVGEAISNGLLSYYPEKIVENWDEIWSEAEDVLVQLEPEAETHSMTPEQVEAEREIANASNDERDKATSVGSEKLAYSKDKTDTATISVEKQDLAISEKKDVSDFTEAEKLGEALKLTGQKLPKALGEQLMALVSPTSLAIMVGVFGAYTASHAVGIGFIADAAMLVGGGVFLGWQAVDVAKDLWAFAQYVNATTESELDKAADHLARAIMTVGFDVILGILTKKAAGKVSQHIDDLKQVDKVGKSGDDGLRPTASRGRNTEPLTDAQTAEVKAYAQELGIPEESLAFTQFNTAYGNMFGMERVQVGTDVAPLANPSQSGITANSRISIKGSLAHEWVGHGEAGRAGRAFDRGDLGNANEFNIALDEAQASIRAARFAPSLTSLERYTLLRDGIARLKNIGISIKEVRHLLYIDKP